MTDTESTTLGSLLRALPHESERSLKQRALQARLYANLRAVDTPDGRTLMQDPAFEPGEDVVVVTHDGPELATIQEVSRTRITIVGWKKTFSVKQSRGVPFLIKTTEPLVELAYQRQLYAMDGLDRACRDLRKAFESGEPTRNVFAALRNQLSPVEDELRHDWNGTV